MPELPEVERARRALDESAGGKRVVWLQAQDDTIVFVDGSEKEIKSAMEGRVVESVARKGKHLCLVMEAGSDVCVHLGMAGSIKVFGKKSISYQSLRKGDENGLECQNECAEVWPPRWCKFEMELEGGGKVAFVDPRRLGRVRVVNDRLSAPFWTSLGPDAMDSLPNDEELCAMLMKRRAAPIKSVILDQSFLAGIGNWIADEVLYQSKLHPERRVHSLSPHEIRNLRKTIEYVVTHAVKSNANSALYPRQWLFHYRWTKKKESKTADGAVIKFCTVGSRTSAYVPSVQKNRKTMPVDKKEEGENACVDGADVEASVKKEALVEQKSEGKEVSGKENDMDGQHEGDDGRRRSSRKRKIRN